MSIQNYRHLTWDDIEQQINILDNLIKKKYQPHCIVTLMNGGLIAARLIADHLSIKKIFPIFISYYDIIGNKKDQPIIQPITFNVKDMNVLIVDDIFDSGASITMVHDALTEYKPKRILSSTLLCKENAKQKPTFFAEDASEDEWIVFPWEEYEFNAEMKGKIK